MILCPLEEEEDLLEDLIGEEYIEDPQEESIEEEYIEDL